MAGYGNFLYDTGRNGFLTKYVAAGNASIDWLNDVICATLIHSNVSGTETATAYPWIGTTPLATVQAHSFFSQVEAFTTAIVPGAAGAGLYATPQIVGTKTAVAGVAGCADIPFAGVSGSFNVNAVIIWKKTAAGTSANAPLIAYIDNAATGIFAIAPNGSSITLQIDTGPNKLFKL